MTESYNGWPASQDPDAIGINSRWEPIDGHKFPQGVKGGDVEVVFTYLVRQLNKRVEPISIYKPGDEWGYYYRKNRNSDNLSCHSSGTAIDYNATEHPNGKAGTFSAAQVKEIREILAELGGVVKWGGDFKGTKDEMHFEICKGRAEVKAVADRLRAPKKTAAKKSSGDRHLGLTNPPMTGEDVRNVQHALNVAGNTLRENGIYNTQTANLVFEFQRNRGISERGVGPQTWAALRKVVHG